MKCESMEFELPEGQLGVQLGEYLCFLILLLYPLVWEFLMTFLTLLSCCRWYGTVLCGSTTSLMLVLM